MASEGTIHGYSDPRLVQMSPEVIADITLSGARDFAKRSIPGAFIMFLALLVSARVTEIASDSPLFYYTILSLLGTSVVSRLFILKSLKHQTPETLPAWQRIFSVAVMTTSICWGVFLARVFELYGLTISTVVILLMTIGIAGGAAIALFIWRGLAQLYLVVLLLLPMVSVLQLGEGGIAFGIAFALVVYFVFLFFQIIRANGEYWHALINTRMLQLQAEELSQAKRAAEKANSAKSSFLANMSHELRTPMNAILGFTQIMADDSTLSEGHRRNIREVNRAGEHLLNLINEILDLTKIEGGYLKLDKRGFDLYAMVDELATLMAPSASTREIELSIHVDPVIPRLLEGDELRIRQILINLIGNAIKFTREGKVSVEVTRAREGHYRFEVQDSGIGIESGAIPSLFKPFTQADATTTRRYGGTGLGLAISYQLVKLMGGELGVESEPGIGSRFWFHLPMREGIAAMETPNREDAGSSRGEGTARQGGSVLVVEDNRVNQMVAQKILVKLGLQVATADNGIEALDKVASGHFDLIFMDVQMPEMDGYETTRRIRAREAEGTARHTIIAMTANAMSGDRELCLAAGMDDYITKPIKMGELKQVIDHWCRANGDGICRGSTPPP